jgi:hypothetical protein
LIIGPDGAVNPSEYGRITTIVDPIQFFEKGMSRLRTIVLDYANDLVKLSHLETTDFNVFAGGLGRKFIFHQDISPTTVGCQAVRNPVNKSVTNMSPVYPRIIIGLSAVRITQVDFITLAFTRIFQ